MNARRRLTWQIEATFVVGVGLCGVAAATSFHNDRVTTAAHWCVADSGGTCYQVNSPHAACVLGELNDPIRPESLATARFDCTGIDSLGYTENFIRVK